MSPTSQAHRGAAGRRRQALLLDLGGAEEVADLIARQSLGEPGSLAVTDARPVPADG